MAITVLSPGAQVAQNTTPLTAPLPAGVSAGTMGLLAILGAGNRTITPDVDWDEILNYYNSTANMRLVLADIIAGASEPDPVSTINTASNGWAGQVAGFDGVDSTQALDTSAVSSELATVQPEFTPTGITTTTPGAMVVAAVCSGIGPTVNAIGLKAGSEQGFTLLMGGADYNYTVAYDMAFALAYKTVASPGAVTMPTFEKTVGTDQYWAGIVVALRPEGATDPNATVTPNTVGVAATFGLSSLTAPVQVAPVVVSLIPFNGYQYIDLSYTGVIFQASVSSPLVVEGSGFAVFPIPVQVGITVPGREVGSSTVTVSPVTVGFSSGLSSLMLGPFSAQLSPVTVGITAVQVGGLSFVPKTISTYEVGYFARDTTESVLVLVYGLNRSLPTGWSSGEGWTIVSSRFVFNNTTVGRQQVDAAVAGAWSSDRDSPVAVLLIEMNRALHAAGYRGPGGTDLV